MKKSQAKIRLHMFTDKSAILIMLLVFCLGFGALSACNSPGGSENTAGITTSDSSGTSTKVITGAESLISTKLRLLKGRKVAIAANHTALVRGTHLVDTLHDLGIDIVRIFAPEHGFRGDHDAGARVDDSRDPETGIEVVSLYGKNKKPDPKYLEDVDLVVFDIQDVGARFYTYISTMSYLMEACAETKTGMMILDRPNPNGWYVDGPVMSENATSFIGLHAGVPVAHGMTIAEYAKMVNAEGWLSEGKSCALQLIPCENYSHDMKWEETGLQWMPPSPNLPNEYSAYLYPMLCFFEGMHVSVGRGTDYPFQIFGSPWHEGFRYSWRKDSVMEVSTPSKLDLYGMEIEVLRFTPRSVPGKSTYPKFEGDVCWGGKFLNRVDSRELFLCGLSLIRNHIEEKKNVNLRQDLFRSSFRLLTGGDELRQMLEDGMPPEDIYDSWQKEIGMFKNMRRKYLLYPDF